jgi:hypothetical protein
MGCCGKGESYTLFRGYTYKGRCCGCSSTPCMDRQPPSENEAMQRIEIE